MNDIKVLVDVVRRHSRESAVVDQRSSGARAEAVQAFRPATWMPTAQPAAFRKAA